MHGKIIIIEGLDGCGKSTQVDLLKKHFTGENFRFLSFPDYDSLAGEIILEYLNRKIPETDPQKSAYSASSFYAIDRYISYRKDWRVDYEQGKTIISARYTTSNAIYQMTKLPRSEWETYRNWLYDYEYQKLGIPQPDEVIFLDVPVEVSQKLLSERYQGQETKKDLHEADIEFLKHCRDSALYASQAGKPWKFLQCCENAQLKPIETIQNELIQLIENITHNTP